GEAPIESPEWIRLAGHRGVKAAGGRHGLRRPADDGGEIPNDEAARGHQEAREHEKRLPPQRVTLKQRVVTEPRHEGTKGRVAKEQQGNEGAESQRQRDLAPEPLAPESSPLDRGSGAKTRKDVGLQSHT